jgi:hypothetical protein
MRFESSRNSVRHYVVKRQVCCSCKKGVVGGLGSNGIGIGYVICLVWPGGKWERGVTDTVRKGLEVWEPSKKSGGFGKRAI